MILAVIKTNSQNANMSQSGLSHLLYTMASGRQNIAAFIDILGKYGLER